MLFFISPWKNCLHEGNREGYTLIYYLLNFLNRMESHSSHHSHQDIVTPKHHDIVTPSGKNLSTEIEIKLTSELQSMLNFATEKYNNMMPLAKIDDDRQGKFTSTAANTLEAYTLTAGAATRAANSIHH